MSDFQQERTKVPIETEITASGIDIDHLLRVVNYDVPEAVATCVHRIGRTGRRAEAIGMAISFCDHEEAGYLKSIQQLIASLY